MRLRGRKEREMVPAVANHSADGCHGVPQPGHGEVRTHDEWTCHGREEDGDNVLHWVDVQGGHSHRGCPLMVHLVDVLVEVRVMEEPICRWDRAEVHVLYYIQLAFGIQ